MKNKKIKQLGYYSMIVFMAAEKLSGNCTEFVSLEPSYEEARKTCVRLHEENPEKGIEIKIYRSIHKEGETGCVSVLIIVNSYGRIFDDYLQMGTLKDSFIRALKA